MLPLLPSVRRDDAPVSPVAEPSADCAYCGLPIGLHGENGRSCAVCVLVCHLERPRIDEEAQLIWLPEMSQAALVCLVREMHGRLHAAGEGFDGTAAPALLSPERRALHYARAALLDRAAIAVEHLGTKRPSELASVLARLPRPAYDRRHRLLGGLRVLPTGRIFLDSEDVYPAAVESWQRPQPISATGHSPARGAA